MSGNVMLKRLSKTYLLALALVLLIPIRASAHDGNTLHVGPGGDYATLTEALAFARPDMTIELLPGTYTGQWTISLPLTLTGQPGSVLDGGGKGTLLTITASGVTVEGLTIRNSGRSLLDDDAAIRVLGNDAHIRYNRIEDVHHAIYAKDGAARTQISGNIIHGREALLQEDRGNGIHLWNAPDTVVEGNVVSGVRDGIYVGFAPRSTFRNNIFQRLRYGIHFMYADDNIFEDNIFEHSEAGAALMYSKHITLRRNVFAHSRSNRAYGLLLQECDNVLVEDNLLAGNSRALFVNVTRDSVFQHNLFAANDLAVQIYAGSTGNIFRGNDFVANMQLIELDQAGSNRWESNYWEGYHGLDMDGDGFGDASFTTGDPLGTLTTEHPQLKLFRYSPAVQALEAGERAFPVLELPAITDARPSIQPVAQASGRLPAPPSAARTGQLPLALFSLACVLAALTIVWLGHRITARRPILRRHGSRARRGAGQTNDDRQLTRAKPDTENYQLQLYGSPSVAAPVIAETVHD
jgi:nitrous oxidase accessory protein